MWQIALSKIKILMPDKKYSRKNLKLNKCLDLLIQKKEW